MKSGLENQLSSVKEENQKLTEKFSKATEEVMCLFVCFFLFTHLSNLILHSD